MMHEGRMRRHATEEAAMNRLDEIANRTVLQCPVEHIGRGVGCGCSECFAVALREVVEGCAETARAFYVRSDEGSVMEVGEEIAAAIRREWLGEEKRDDK